MRIGGREAAAVGFATAPSAADNWKREVLAIAERVARIPTEVQQMDERGFIARWKSGMRAAIRAGTEIQALTFQTEPSKEYMTRFPP